MDIPQSWLDTESLSKLEKKPQVFVQNAVKKKWKSQEAEWGSARGPTVFERERLRESSTTEQTPLPREQVTGYALHTQHCTSEPPLVRDGRLLTEVKLNKVQEQEQKIDWTTQGKSERQPGTQPNVSPPWKLWCRDSMQPANSCTVLAATAASLSSQG